MSRPRRPFARMINISATLPPKHYSALLSASRRRGEPLSWTLRAAVALALETWGDLTPEPPQEDPAP